MQYQISYLSPNGHARKLADAIRQILPSDTIVLDLEKECEAYAETQIIGFEMNEVSFRAVPYRIMEFLNELEKHRVILFLTTPFRADVHMKALAEHRLEPFVPETCCYSGLYICTSQASDWLLQTVRTYAEQNPEDVQAIQMLQRCEGSIGHPDTDDIREVCRFVAETLEIEYE